MQRRARLWTGDRVPYHLNLMQATGAPARVHVRLTSMDLLRDIRRMFVNPMLVQLEVQ